MHNIKQSLEYAGQASSVFVKPLTQQSVLAAIRSKWHSKFALHPRSTTIRLRIKQGMAARAGLRIQLHARRRAPDDDGDVVSQRRTTQRERERLARSRKYLRAASRLTTLVPMSS